MRGAVYLAGWNLSRETRDSVETSKLIAQFGTAFIAPLQVGFLMKSSSLRLEHCIPVGFNNSFKNPGESGVPAD